MQDWRDLAGNKVLTDYLEARETGYLAIDEVVAAMGISESQTRRILRRTLIEGKVLQINCSHFGKRFLMYKLL